MLLLLPLRSANAAEMGTEVTYLGFLDDGGIPVSGQVDIRLMMTAVRSSDCGAEPTKARTLS